MRQCGGQVLKGFIMTVDILVGCRLYTVEGMSVWFGNLVSWFASGVYLILKDFRCQSTVSERDPLFQQVFHFKTVADPPYPPKLRPQTIKDFQNKNLHRFAPFTI